MLPRENRLPSQRIRPVLTTGKDYRGKDLQLFVLPNQEGVVRFAILVPTKLDKRSSARNRLKRKIREVIRSLLAPAYFGKDVVVRILKPRLEKQATVSEELEDLFKKASLFERRDEKK